VTTHLKPLIFAWQFLTAVPLTRECHAPAPDELAGSMLWYPFVGVLLGGCLAITDALLSQWLSREAVAALLIVLLVAITRGLHQDGLADTLDGLAGARTATDRLAIMRYAALVSVPETMRLPILLCMPAMGRWAMVVGAYGARYARTEGGLAAPFLTHLSARHVLGATIVVLSLLVWAFGGMAALVALSTGGLVSRLATRFYQRMFGGVTGDTLGATNELIEVSFVLLMPALLSLP
jgi:adenosylcobinamide-GDP ribazoletransferase